jgi:hypothetical protein
VLLQEWLQVELQDDGAFLDQIVHWLARWGMLVIPVGIAVLVSRSKNVKLRSSTACRDMRLALRLMSGPAPCNAAASS